MAKKGEKIKMEETKNLEFNIEDEEVEKSKVIETYPARAEFVVNAGKYKSYELRCVAKISESKNHTRKVALLERNETDQFLIKILSENQKKNKSVYTAVLEKRQNNETNNIFFCWIIAFDKENKLYKSMLCGREEKYFLESYLLAEQKTVTATAKEKVVK